MDDVLCDFSSAHKKALLKDPEIIYPQNKYGYWQKLKPLKNAIETVAYLKQHFDVYILSSPSIYNPFCYAEKRVWVEEHLGFDMLEKLILSHNKGLNKGDYLIDDHINGKGQEKFEGELLHFGSDNFPDWKAVLQYFKKIIQ